MKRILLSLCSVALSAVLIAGNEKEVPSGIKNVTVYLRGAQISRQGSVALQKGRSTLVFTSLPADLVPESLQATASEGVTILSVTQSTDYLNKNTVSKEIAALNNHRKALLDSIGIVKNYRSVYVQEKEMILANKSIAGNNGVNIADLQQAAEFFRKRLTEIEVSLHRIDNILFILKTDLVNSSQQMLELSAKVDQPTSQVRIEVLSEKDVSTDIQLGYFIADAGWTPCYDVRIKDVNEPLCLYYKAKVFQNTGEEWENVMLTLSTGNPSVSNNKPDLSSYFLTFDNYYTTRQGFAETTDKGVRGSVSGTITDASTGEPLIGAAIVVKGTDRGVVSDINGNYSLGIPGGSVTVVASFIGFNPQEFVVNSSRQDISLKPSEMSLDEVVVTGYSSADSDYVIAGGISRSRVNKIEQIPLAIEKRQLTTEFRIDTPYSIPSDNKPYDVTMVEYNIEASYKYSAVPKLAPDAFLVAGIPDFTRYNLLGGKVNIFFKGIYQGESVIDPDISDDTLMLSVGRDKDIIVLRECQKDLTGRSMTGNSRKEQKAWLITVKNNKDIPINIAVEDQYPVSKTDEIKVDLIDSAEALNDRSTGKLTWNLNLASGEKKAMTLKYTVRYPAGRKVLVD